MSGARHRRKGSRVEREIVEAHRELGLEAKRIPLSGAAPGFAGDVVVTLADGELRGEVKARKAGAGFATLERWLGPHDVLFLRRDHAPPMVVLPWRTWARVLEIPASGAGNACNFVGLPKKAVEFERSRTCHVRAHTHNSQEDALSAVGKAMKFVIEIDREEDGRWIAEVSSLPGVMAYGSDQDEAVRRVKALALHVLADRAEHGESDLDANSISFAPAAVA